MQSINFSDEINRNNTKIKRCNNKFEENCDYFKNLNIDDLFNDIVSNQK